MKVYVVVIEGMKCSRDEEPCEYEKTFGVAGVHEDFSGALQHAYYLMEHSPGVLGASVCECVLGDWAGVEVALSARQYV
ncbi:MAG: hypothetical protein JXJ17_04420 [Anaerolineae bacterium]|nr:hypothetical protein [Anaerolineae bacterium]